MCLKPVPVWIDKTMRSKNGKKVLRFTPPMSAPVGRLVSDTATQPDMFVPCGKCVLCRSALRREWIKRMRLELFSNPDATFITLTYDDEHCPEGVNKPDVQNFIKRLRNLKRDYGITLPKFKYFICSEYGSRTYRPHYHGIIFGVDCVRAQFMRAYVATTKVDNGRRYPVISSRVLERVWRNGFVSIDAVTPSSIRYVSKYIVKGDNDFDMDGYFPNFYLYSRRIGTGLFLRKDGMTDFAYSSFGRGRMLIDRDGYEESAPRFLRRYFDMYDADFAEEIASKRRDFALHKPPSDFDSAKARAEFIINERAKYKQKEILT